MRLKYHRVVKNFRKLCAMQNKLTLSYQNNEFQSQIYNVQYIYYRHRVFVDHKLLIEVNTTVTLLYFAELVKRDEPCHFMEIKYFTREFSV